MIPPNYQYTSLKQSVHFHFRLLTVIEYSYVL